MMVPFWMVIAVLSVVLAAIRPPLRKVRILPPRFKVVAPATTRASELISRSADKVVVPMVPMRTLSVVAALWMIAVS